MLALSPLAVPDVVGSISTGLDLLGLDMSSSLACQLVGGTDADAVAIYASNLPTITSVAQAFPTGLIGALAPAGYEFGLAPVQFANPRYRYLYVVRVNAATLGVTLQVVGQETSGTATPSVTLVGDVVGPSGANSVAKLQGTTLTLAGLASGQFIGVSGGVIGNIAPTGDVTFSSAFASTVAKLQGTTLTLNSPTNGQIIAVAAGAVKNVAITGDVVLSSSLVATVAGIRGYTLPATPAPTAGQAVTFAGGSALAWATPSVTSARPASDNNTLLDYRFNETAYAAVYPNAGVLVNHGSYGTGASGSLGPAPTTTTAGFTQPTAGNTVTVSVASSTGYQASQMVILGARVSGGGGGSYYFVTAVGTNTLTLKNLGIVGSVSSGTTILSGTLVTASLDLLYPSSGGYPAVCATGPYDYAQYFGLLDYVQPGWCNAYSDGYVTGGCPDFNGITHASVHVLLNRVIGVGNSTTNQTSMWFGYSNTRAWSAPYTTLAASLCGNTVLGTWNIGGGGQTFTQTVSRLVGSGYAGAGLFDLISYTVDLTVTSQAIKYYRNGQLVGTGDISATGSMTFGSTGYWFAAQPSVNLGDNGDRTMATIAMCRYENVTRSAAYIQAMWQSIVPASANWPVP